MSRLLLHLHSGPSTAAFNMALDEALLSTAAGRGHALLRFYGWTEPAATFGYFQRFTDIERITRLRPLIRRPTGGGLVPHDHDWTYSLAVPPGHTWYELSAVESYRTVHAWIVRALARLDLESELADCCRKVLPGQCFEGWERFDVLRLGRKIAGAAQRRNRLGLLIQGSIRPPANTARAAWEQAMIATPPAEHFDETGPCTADAPLLELARELDATRYGQATYNAMR